MAKGVTPNCRYGHGNLVQSNIGPDQAKGIGIDRPIGSYFVPVVVGENVNLGGGFIFEIWTCEKCSYLELHDHEKIKAAK